MQRIVIIANGAAYGSESLFNSLRLAIALREQQSDLDLKLFLMSDAVTAGLRGQKPAEGYNAADAGDPHRPAGAGEVVQNLRGRPRRQRATAD